MCACVFFSRPRVLHLACAFLPQSAAAASFPAPTGGRSGALPPRDFASPPIKEEAGGNTSPQLLEASTPLSNLPLPAAASTAEGGLAALLGGDGSSEALRALLLFLAFPSARKRPLLYDPPFFSHF